MQNKIPTNAGPSHSANDNGPLSPGQVKLLKLSIAIMGFLIVAALLAIVGRTIYLSTVPKKSAQLVSPTTSTLAPEHTLALPPGAIVKTMALHGDRLLLHYETPAGPGAKILDLATGKVLSQVNFTVSAPISQ